VGITYLSPVDKSTGIICDYGVTYYLGNNKKIQDHLRNCLAATEDIAQQAEVGMSFKGLYIRADRIIAERGLHNDWMITYNDPTHSADYGHTTPWTHEIPTEKEKHVIDSEDFRALKDLISSKRLYINSIEDFAIPENVVFSIEPRLGSKNDPRLPCGYFYCLVAFQDGEKKVVSNFNPIFDTLGIKYMRSRYG
jgi:hypothetical protein